MANPRHSEQSSQEDSAKTLLQMKQYNYILRCASAYCITCIDHFNTVEMLKKSIMKQLGLHRYYWSEYILNKNLNT